MLFNHCSCFFVLDLFGPYLIYISFSFSGLFVLILVALLIGSSTPIKRGCSLSGFKELEPLMSFRDPEEEEEEGLLWMYVLYNPKKPRNLHRCEKLWRKRCLILMFFLIAEIESNPSKFYKYYFYYSSRAV